MSTAKVDTPVPAYERMADEWKLPEDLTGGTIKMREASRTASGGRYRGSYLPQHEHESANAYEERLFSTFLFPGYEEAIGGLSARPFSKATTVNKEAPGQVHEWAKDVDNAGRDLSQFAHDVLRMGIHRGMAHLLPEFPNTGVLGRTIADDIRDGVRPHLVLIDPMDVIGWRLEKSRGKQRIIQLRVKETVTIPDGDWGEKDLKAIRVYQKTADGVVWELHVQPPESDEYVLLDEGTYSLPEIALSTFYTNRTAMMEACPSLGRLAEINLQHWQSSSDHRGLFRFARAGVLFGAGIKQEELGGTATVGNRLWLASDYQASLRWVEHEGRALGASKADLDDLKADMAALSLRPLMRSRPGNATATETAIDTAETNASLLSWVRRAENAIAMALKNAARFAGIENANVSVDICDDVGLDPSQNADIETLMKLRSMGELTSPTFLSELRRRGLFSDAFDAEAESAALEVEEPLELTAPMTDNMPGEAEEAA